MHFLASVCPKTFGVFNLKCLWLRPHGRTLSLFCLALIFVFPLGLFARRYAVPTAIAARRTERAAEPTVEARRSGDARDESRQRGATSRARLSEAYGKLSLSFAARPGQKGAPAAFFARGNNFGLYLDASGATLALRRPAPEGSAQQPAPRSSGTKQGATGAVLRVSFVGANASPRIGGVGELPGKANYFIGSDPALWHAGVATYERVRYEGLYPGVDLLFYGNQGQLEYDFVLAPGADPRVLKLDFEGAKKIDIASNGDLVLRTEGGDVRQHKPVVYQEVAGIRREIAGRYVLAGGRRVGFKIGKYDRQLPLVVDPVLSYSTFLGGSSSDQSRAIAVDAAGNAYLTGHTTSTDFPTVNPSQATQANWLDAFVTKLNADGSAIVYSTYLGGSLDDVANSIAVDGGGNVYLTGETFSPDFPLLNPLQSARSPLSTDSFVTKLNASGSALVYSTYLGGEATERGAGIAVDAAGNAYVTGATFSNDFPVVNAAQTAKEGNNIFKSADAGSNWPASDNGLSNAHVFDLEITPGAPNVIYAATGRGVFKSTDGGGNWVNTGGALLDVFVQDVEVNPTNTSVVFAAADSGLYRSNDGGATWTPVPDVYANMAVAVAPTSPATVYAATFSQMHRSADGGNTWTTIESNGVFNDAAIFNVIVVDPANSSNAYTGTDRGVHKTTNSGLTWIPLASGLSAFANVLDIAVARSNPNILYAATTLGVYKSTNGGASWSQIGTQTFTGLSVRALTVDPVAPSNVIAATSFGGIYKSTDGGATWASVTTDLRGIQFNTLAADPAVPSNFYAGSSSSSDVYVAKLNASGTSLVYSTYLGGKGSDQGSGIAVDPAGNAHVAGLTGSSDFRVSSNALYPTYSGANDAFAAKLNLSGSALAYSTYLGGAGNDSANGIALDAAGNAYVVGSTASTNFPTANPLQPNNGGGTDAFITKLNAAGTNLVYSTYLGGSVMDTANAVALDAGGNAYLTGQTTSSNFPVVSAVQTTNRGSTDAFVAKLNAAGSGLTYSTYLGGTSNDLGLGIAVDAAGSAYVSGFTLSAFSFPLARPLQPASAGSSEVFVAKLMAGIDLALGMTDAPDPVAFGSALTYTLTAQNNGDLPATGVSVTDTLPAGVTFVSASATQGACAGTSVVRCDLGALHPGASATIQLVIKPHAARSITNSAFIAAAETDLNQSNNTATQETLVDFADLSLTAAPLQEFVSTGGRVTYILAASNNGATTADNVNINVALPAGLTVVSCTAAPGGTCGGAGNSRTVTFPTLAVNASQSVIIVAEVNGGIADGTTLPVTANATSSRPDPDSSNNGATATATVSSTVVQPKINGKIAFTVYGDGLYTMNDDGTNITKIYSETDGHFSLATWSPDGTKIAFNKEKSSSSFITFEICVVNADGSGPRVLSANGALDSRPTWSPSGAFVGFVARDRNSVQAVNATGTPATTALFNTTSILEDVSWSPDGSKLLYSTANAQLWTVNTDGSNQKLLDIDPNTNDTMPVWSPDGAKILFLRNFNSSQSGDVSIYTMNADGTNAQPLPNPVIRASSLMRPVFSPDGTMIAFQLGDSINKMNADGTNITRIPAGGQGGSAPSWQPLPASGPPPPPVPTFTISGRVTPPSGETFLVTGFVRLDLTGSRTASAFPDSNGNYSFTLPVGGNYTVTPAVNPFYNFGPGSYTFNNLSADQPGANFTATRKTISISGRVTRVGGKPLVNIAIILNRPGFPTRTQVTAADGAYAFNDLDFNSTYIVSVASGSRTLHTFTPDAASFSLLTESQIVDFVGAPVKQFEFTAERFDAGEGQGRGTVTVARVGDASAPASVEVRTFDNPAAVPCDPTIKQPDGSNYPSGQAYARCDYATTIETITWAAGDAQPKTLEIPIIDDAHKEGIENLGLILGSPQGGIIGYLDTTNLYIQDNDATTGPNPIYTTPFFVRLQYLDFLSREPEAGEPWSAVLNNCSNVNNNPACDRITVSQSFFGSPEFRLKGFYVFNFYRVAFNRRPTYEEIIPDMRSVTGATEQEVYQKRAAFPASFASRAEFAGLYAALSDTAFVNTLMDRYALQQITTPDPSNPEGGTRMSLSRTQLVTRLGASGAQALTRAQVLRAVVESNEVGAAEYNRAFVAMQYYGYLRRTPEEDGYQAWLRVINEDPQNVRLMVNGFMNSPEYRLRFGQP